ncbi:penicillin-binding protein 2 [Suttonella sp. R2A3]|uniref:penicillin-binding protein 2 n=1 Tax=Suttonella sp. R2A3 TaxID=2908648 RepID=UPI001F3EBAD1|nr:penicillin-binding protein 2 [Suttonella sp. R2A3]UJF24293.1 penicillin-binding protein 2 [Suttonella sp. R2A3]
MSKAQASKAENEQYLRQGFARRVLLLGGLAFAGLFALFARMFYLQVLRHDHYRTRAQGNRVRVKPIVPERGMIYDRKGRALTENILRYQLVANPSQVANAQALLDTLAGTVALSAQERADFLEAFARSRRYEYVVLKPSLGEAEYYRLSTLLYRFPGVAIESTYERYYPYGSLLSHVLGYTNRISEKDLAVINLEDYHGINSIGRSGLEKQYEERLRGKSGSQQLEADANGNMVRLLSELPAQRGQDVYLSLDVTLQEQVYAAMGNYRGACVALDPRNGEVLAMVSKPSFDANLFVRGITHRQYQRLLDDPFSPMYHRAVRGRYAPGSVIKPMMGLAGLHYGVFDANSSVFCSGNYRIPDSSTKRRFHCWNRSGHGSMDLHHAIAQSCDVYFYSLGYKLGVARISEYAAQFSFGEQTGIDLPDESSGILPTPEWKKAQHDTSWYIGDTINISIGQGFLTTTPLQLAQMTALIANDGVFYQPHLLRQVYDPEKEAFLTNQAGKQGTKVPLYDEAAWQRVKKAMEAVMHSRYGTARNVGAKRKYRMAGKSGTVQVISFQDNRRLSADELADEHQDNAMFVAYAPADAPRIAVSMVVERGGGGSSTAAPMVAEIIDHYLSEADNA